MISSVDICTLDKANLIHFGYSSHSIGYQVKKQVGKKRIFHQSKLGIFTYTSEPYLQQTLFGLSDLHQGTFQYRREIRVAVSQKKNAEMKNYRDQTTVNSGNIPSFRTLSN